MWLERRLAHLRDANSPVILSAAEVWGTPYLIAELGSEDKPLVWLHLTPDQANDPVAQGNELADALRRALNSSLFGYGLHYSYGLSVLRGHLSLLGPFTFALSGASHGRGLARELLSLAGEGNEVVLAFEKGLGTFAPPDEAKLVTEADLRVTRAEAMELAGEHLEIDKVFTLLEKSGGAFETFNLLLSEELSLPPPLKPFPDGLRPVEELQIDPDGLLDALVNRKRWFKALEVAVYNKPERVPELLKEAGQAYQDRGLYQRLSTLLSNLPETIKKDETVLFWLLATALRLGKFGTVATLIEAHLENHPAPELRALYYANISSQEKGLYEVRQAYEYDKTALTSYLYSLRLYTTRTDTHLSVQMAREAVELAEQADPYIDNDLIRNAFRLGDALYAVGKYREALQWTKWALELFDQQQLGDWQRRLLLVNNYAYFRILVGDTRGILPMLEKGVPALNDISKHIADTYRITIGDFHVSTGNPGTALPYYQQILNEAPRQYFAFDAENVISVLLSLEKFDEARNLAEKSLALSKDAYRVSEQLAGLTYGMVLTFQEPESALPVLKVAYDAFTNPLDARHAGRAALYLAKAYLLLEQPIEAVTSLQESKESLSELGETGRRLFGCPERLFKDVWALLDEKSATDLELKFLGQPEVAFKGEPLKFPPRWLEVLALLAANPQGLSSEQLLLLLYGEHGNVSTLKATLSKLRQVVPLASRPYRIEVDFQADFVELEQALRSGDIRTALDHYAGSLLSESQAPGIVELREGLEEKVRQATLNSEDAELLTSMAEVAPDDLDILEAALAATSRENPSYPILRAQIARVTANW